MKLNRLMLHNLKIATVMDIEEWSKQCRHEGKSLGLAMKYISEAILNIDKPVKIVDHFGTPQSNRFLMEQVQGLISKLSLVGFSVRQPDNTIIYNPYIEV